MRWITVGGAAAGGGEPNRLFPLIEPDWMFTPGEPKRGFCAGPEGATGVVSGRIDGRSTGVIERGCTVGGGEG